MPSPLDVIARIQQAFAGSEYPGNRWLIGSTEGTEPAEEVGPFIGRTRWEEVEPELLDRHYPALSFFSEAGFRFFLPAFLVADLRDQLEVADPLGHLTRGFYDSAIEMPAGGRVFVQRFGASSLVNPLRYGAMTIEDMGRHRLSIFTREESAAIVAYLEYKRDAEPIDKLKAQIAGALDRFWRDRAAHAPTAAQLREHLDERRAYLDALRGSGTNSQEKGQ